MSESLHPDVIGHGLVTGRPRCGKGSSVIIPQILRADNRAIVILGDFKGEIHHVVHAHRKRQGPYLLVDPKGVTGHKSCGYNPYVELDPRKNFYKKATSAAADVCPIRPEDSQKIFPEGGQNFYAAMAMFTKLAGGERASPIDVQRLINLPLKSRKDPETKEELETSIETIMRRCVQGRYSLYDLPGVTGVPPSPCPYPEYDVQKGGKPFGPLQLLARQFMSHHDGENRFLEDRISTLRTQTKILNDDELAADMMKTPKWQGEPFRFSRMRHWAKPKLTNPNRGTGVFTVNIVLPPEDIPGYGAYLRLILSSAINSLMASQGPVWPLIIVDEMGQYGPVNSFMGSINMAAGLRLQYVFVYQMISQMLKAYGQHGVGEITGACDVEIAFGNSDPETKRYFSDKSGSRAAYVRSLHDKAIGKGQSSNQTQHSVPLVRPEDIQALDDRNALGFIGRHVARMKMPAYYDRRAFPDLAGKYGRNPTQERAA